MPSSTWRNVVIDYIRAQARPVDKFSHQPRLYALAGRLGEGLAYDDDVVFAAAWLHDLGVFVGHRPEDPAALAAWDNVGYAMRRAPELLRGFGFSAEKIPAVVEAIRTHLPARDPATLEGTILRDADILEQLGAPGILRTVSKVGRDTRFPTLAEAIGALRRQLRDLPGQLRLPRAREIAEARVALLRCFLEGVEAEAGGGAW